jgi:hypothetical protein
MFNPYVLLGALAGAILLFAGGAWTGREWCDRGWRASMQEAQQEHTKALLRELEKSNAAAMDLEQARAQRKVVYRTITKEVERIVAAPGFDRVCFADDAVYAVNSAIRGEAPAAGKPPDGVPAPKPLVGRTGRNSPQVSN